MRDEGCLIGVPAEAAHIPAIEELMLGHGPNEWNHLPPDTIKDYLSGIATGAAFGVVAMVTGRGGQLLGVATYDIGHRYPQYQPEGRESEPHGYVSEVVVHRDQTRVGLGTDLFRAAIESLTSTKKPWGHGLLEVYAMRHTDNVPSGRMMEKSGMVVVDEFPDPDIQPTGSRSTTVTRFMV